MTSGLPHKGSGLVDVSESRGYTVLLLHALLEMSKLAFLKHFGEHIGLHFIPKCHGQAT